MQRLVRPGLELGVELVLVVLQTLQQPVTVGLVDDGVVELHPDFLDVSDLGVIRLPRTRDPEHLVALGEHSDTRERLAHHVSRGGVHRFLVVIAVPGEDDCAEPGEPWLHPQVIDVLGQRLAMAFSAVEQEQLVVEPLEGDPSRSIGVHAGAADVERNEHWMSAVEVELSIPLLFDHLHVRLAVDGSCVHLLE